MGKSKGSGGRQQNRNGVGPHDPIHPLEVERRTIRAEEVVVTPAMARKWLGEHENIRSVSWSRVESFANDMRAGAWRLTHQGICFDGNGLLVDGQHRLQAICQADCEVLMLVFTNSEARVADPLDRGRPRAVSTLIGRTQRFTAALNGLRMLESGMKLSAPMTVAEASDTEQHHAEALTTLCAQDNRALVGGLLAGCAWAYPVDPAKVLAFLSQVRTGEMLRRGDAAYAMRAWLTSPAMRANQTWEVMLAVLGCASSAIVGVSHHSVYPTAEAGYRWLTGRRRSLGIPHTPVASLVPSGNGPAPDRRGYKSGPASLPGETE